MFGKKKVSIDFSEPCYQSMTATAKDKKLSNSTIINTLIEVFMQLSPAVIQDIGAYCLKRYLEEKTAADALTGFSQQEKAICAEQYHRISEYFGIKAPDVRPGMQKIFLKDGYVIFPKDWIVIPDIYDSPDKCLYAGVVESRNHEKYHIPHFVFFSNYRYGTDYPEDLKDKVFNHCAAVYPEFKHLYNLQLPTPDIRRTDPEGIELMKKWKDAPEFGLFHIVEKGDPHYWNEVTPNYDPPYGAMIIRND